MSPREFLDTVLHELSLDERESLLVDEKQRRTTFLVNWPHDGNLSGIKMAQAGFYCADDNDRVQCVFCHGSLHKWGEQDDPMTEHRKHFPFCRFVKGLECGNKEYRANDLTAKEMRTFTPLLTGFYYTGFDDRVRCLFCDGVLRGWKSGNDPWKEHARWFPHCSLVHNKGGADGKKVNNMAEGRKWIFLLWIVKYVIWPFLLYMMKYHCSYQKVEKKTSDDKFNHVFPLIKGENKEAPHQEKGSKMIDLDSSRMNVLMNNPILTYPVEFHRDGLEPLISQSRRYRLDNMTPQYYLSFILKELSLKERESLLIEEQERRRTFQRNWPHDGNLSGIKMAQAGFYYLDDNDRVQCVFCRGSLHKWEEQDDPMTEHRKHFPFCRFVKGLECGNKEYGANDLTAKELRTFTPLLTGTKRNKVGSTSVDFAELGINSNRPKNPQHALYLVRLKSFATWPANSLVTARDMCCAGFFYTESGDMVTCFHCNVSLRYWRSGEDPWTEHARMSPYCEYLLQRKKKHFIDQVNGVTINESETKRKTNEESKSSEEMPSIADMTNREKLPVACCIPCFQKTKKEKAAHHLGLPCGHPIFCKNCNAVQMKRNDIQCGPVCPYPGCGKRLVGTMEFFL